MKLIHTADLHIGSSLSRHYTKEEAEKRREELLLLFYRLVEYAKSEKVSGILLCGDLFDTESVSKNTVQSVLKAIESAGEIPFFYLKGNHDRENLFLAYFEKLPPNLYFFGTDWSGYRLGPSLTIYGREFASSGSLSSGEAIHRELKLRDEDYNIILLHGTAVEQGEPAERKSGTDREELIYLRDFQHKNIDYMALGHIHKMQGGILDGRGRWQYSGCPEGRGFDECGKHGFLLLDIDPETHSFSQRQVDLGKRHFFELSVDITGAESSGELLQRMQEEIERNGVLPEDGVKIHLKGRRLVNCEVHKVFLSRELSRQYAAVQLLDETELYVDYEKFIGDGSLKGEFVRLIQNAEELSEEEKYRVLQMGIRLLRGEDA